MKTLYLECGMGAAGDMLMGALYELLDDQPGFLRTMNAMGLEGVTIAAEPAVSCGITGTHMAVTVHGEQEKSEDVPPEHAHEHAHDHHEHTHAHHHHAALGDIRAQIARLALPDEVKCMAGGVYGRLAAAEARVHGRSVDQVHFHEVGALDAVADVAGVCYALALLQPDRIVVSPIHVGSGSVRCAHGVMPVPAPATAVLLEGVPCYGGSIRGELCTPTGAALLTAFADDFGNMPPMCLQKTGYGLGSKQFEAANCVRAFLGESEETANGEIMELTCNLDDMTPEALGFAAERLLELGALDVYIVPGQMKKGRPGWVLTALCPPGGQDELAKQIFTHTTTNGLRLRRCAKYYLRPQSEAVDTPQGTIRVKRAEGYGVTHCKPEADDIAALARRTGKSFAQLVREAERLLESEPQH